MKENSMKESQANLGGRLPLLDPGELKGKQKELYDFLDSTFISWADASGFSGKTSDGRFIGPFNPNLHSPGITPSWVQLVQAESKTTSLTKRVREVVILSVGAVWKAPYELYAHSAVARKVGVPEPAIQALVAGKSSEQLSLEEQVAHRFARQLAKEFRVDSDLYQEAESIFGRAGLVDMVYLIGIYLLTSAMLNAFEIPAPE
jgi:4-carboxymuconolactone decarboxylase